LPAIGERIRCDVQDAEHHRPLAKLDFPLLQFPKVKLSHRILLSHLFRGPRTSARRSDVRRLASGTGRLRSSARRYHESISMRGTRWLLLVAIVAILSGLG